MGNKNNLGKQKIRRKNLTATVQEAVVYFSKKKLPIPCTLTQFVEPLVVDIPRIRE